MPVTRPRPSSVTRAMKKQIMELPTSRAATRPFRGAIRIFLILCTVTSRIVVVGPRRGAAASATIGGQTLTRLADALPRCGKGAGRQVCHPIHGHRQVLL